jgi:hypothetical protein
VAFDFGTLPQRLRALEDLAAGSPRGTALEELVGEMFSALPGVDVADRNVHSGSGDAEFDILFSNEQRDDGLPAFDRDVLIECKSSGKPLGSRDVEHFISQAGLRHLRWSIIVSLAGLTGDDLDARAAHRAVERGAEQNTWVMLFAKSELASMRSAEHLAAVVEAKRRKMLLKLRAVTLGERELRDLDPRPTGVSVIRGFAGFEQAMRRLREDALTLILDEALEGRDVADDARVQDASRALRALDDEVEDHREHPDEDPFWREVHARVVSVGAAFAKLLDEDLSDPEGRHRISFDVRATAPQKLDADVGGELWSLLSDYRLRSISNGDQHARTRNAIAMLAMAVDAMIAIDDIDPRDVYGYQED